MTTNRIQRDAETPPPHPGTPDDEVTLVRRIGRDAARRGDCEESCPYKHGPPADDRRMQWFLGFLDVRLWRFYRDETARDKA